MNFFKHVSYANLHRDFFKKLKKQEVDPKITFLKKVAKKSLIMVPEDLADIDYQLKSYSESGFSFEKQ